MQLLSVEGLEKRFFITGNGFRKKRKIVHAVNGVNLSVEEGDIFGIVGGKWIRKIDAWEMYFAID